MCSCAWETKKDIGQWKSYHKLNIEIDVNVDSFMWKNIHEDTFWIYLNEVTNCVKTFM